MLYYNRVGLVPDDALIDMENKKKFAKLCVKALGSAVGGTREAGKELGLSVDDTREVWRQVLTLTLNGGGKYTGA